MPLQNLSEVLKAPDPQLTRLGKDFFGDETFKHLVDGIKREPESAARHFQLGEAFLQLGQLHLAAQVLESGLMIEPQNINALHSMATSLRAMTDEQRDSFKITAEEALERRIRIYDRITELDPSEPQTYFLRGLDLLEAKRPADARRSFEDALRLGVEHLPVYEYLGLAHEMLGDSAAAFDAYRKAVESGDGPVQVRTCLKLARHEFDQGNFEACQKTAEAGLQTHHGFAADALPGSVPLADLMILAAERTHRQPSVTLQYKGTTGHDQVLEALPQPLRAFKEQQILLGRAVTCSALGASCFATLEVASESGQTFELRLAAYAPENDGKVSICEKDSRNSVCFDYFKLKSPRALELFQNLSNWLSAGDVEEAAAQLESHSNSSVEVYPGLGARLAKYFPGLPLGFFPDQGISPVEALRGESKASFSVVGNGGRDSLNIVVSGPANGPFTVTLRSGWAEQDENSRFPQIEAPSLADVPAALSELRNRDF